MRRQTVGQQQGAAANASQLSLRQPAVAFLEPGASLSMVHSSHSSTESERLSVSDTDNEVFPEGYHHKHKAFYPSCQRHAAEVSFYNLSMRLGAN